jgi:hypothetical protein
MKKTLISIVALVVFCLTIFVLRPSVSRAQGRSGVFSVSHALVRHANDGTSVALDADSLNTRVNLRERETAAINLDCEGCTEAVDVVAPHGGLVNGRPGSATIQPNNGAINFTFQPGSAHGSYTVEISSGSHTRALSFRVGPEPPSGKPGPRLTFTPAPEK